MKKRTMHGTVKKVFKAPNPTDAERASIIIEEADDLYREIRIENTLTTKNGGQVKLKEGDDVDVIIEES